jgi:hypothetical protein
MWKFIIWLLLSGAIGIGLVWSPLLTSQQLGAMEVKPAPEKAPVKKAAKKKAPTKKRAAKKKAPTKEPVKKVTK